MSDLLRQGCAWLATMFKSHAAHTVTYVRGEQTVDVLATVGSTTFDVEKSFGVQSFEARDYLVTPADLVLGGVTITPAKGDQVKETIGGTIVVYEVMAPGTEAVWGYCDAGRAMLRVHTKQVGVE